MSNLFPKKLPLSPLYQYPKLKYLELVEKFENEAKAEEPATWFYFSIGGFIPFMALFPGLRSL
jgi:hypothetical protein